MLLIFILSHFPWSLSFQNVNCVEIRSLQLEHSLKIRGWEPGGAPRAEDEHMSADKHKHHDCDDKTFVHSQKCTKVKHIKVFAFFAIVFLISFEILI